MGKLLERLLNYYLKSKLINFNYLKEIKEANKEQEVNEENPINEKFKDIGLGDIVIAARYKNDKERKAMPFGHRCGPFIVIENNSDTLKAIYGTSNKNVLKDYELMKYFTIESDNLHKETVFIINKTENIDDYRFINKVGTLSKEDLKHLVNKLNGLDDNLKLRENMIVRFNNDFYFVKELNKSFATLIKLIRNGKKNLVTVDGIEFEVFLSKPEFVFNLDKLNIVNVVTDRTAKLINKKYEAFNKDVDMPIAERGNLINYNSKLYYVNGVTGQILNCFRVKKLANITHRIIINGTPYEACFDEIKDINSRSLYDICLKASDKEMDEIKEVKKQYAYKQKHNLQKKNKVNNQIKKNIKPGVIIVEKLPLNKTNYIVVKRINNTLYIIDVHDAEEGRFNRVVILDIHQADYVGTYDEYKYYELCTEINKIDTDAVSDKDLLQLKKQEK